MLNAVLALAVSLTPPLLTAEGVALDEKGQRPFEAPFLGAQLDVGAPDGIGASLVVAPGRFFRIHAGGLNNGVGSGVRIGATLIAFPSFGFRPLLGFDAGHAFGGAGEWLPQVMPDVRIAKLISGASVSFANLQVGFELGTPTFAFTLRAGMSWVDIGVASQRLDTSATSSVSASGLVVSGFIPSARLGLLFFFE
jgi:hypothetical protein